MSPAAGSPDRPYLDGKYGGVSLLQCDDFGTRLHARPLLREDEFAAGKIPARFMQLNDEL